MGERNLVDMAATDELGRSLLFVAAVKGHMDVATMLLANDAQPLINRPSHKGNTPLHVAASGGHLTLVQLLVQHGADVDAPNPTMAGASALQVAEMMGHEDVASFLRGNATTCGAPLNLDPRPPTAQ